MRLTLRTLLAYLDDILEPSQAKEIGEKIGESERASGLVSRIRDVLRRRRILAPNLDGPGSQPDANVIAEYLDNTLPPEGVEDVERVCLESDVHLAEVAACHQILTLVLGDPVDIPMDLRERIYALGHTETDRSAGPNAKAAAAPKAVGAADRGSYQESIPDYLKQRPLTRRLLPWIVLLIVAAVWVGILLTDDTYARHFASWFGEPQEVVDLDEEDLAPRDAGLEKVDGAANALQDGNGNAPVDRSVSDQQLLSEEGIDPPPPPDLETSPEIAAIDDRLPTPVPIIESPTGPDAPAMKPANGAEPEVVEVPPDTPQPQADAFDPPKLSTTIQYTSPDGILLRKTSEKQDGVSEWMVLPPRAMLYAAEEVAVPQPFDATFLVGNGKLRVTAEDDTRFQVLAPAEESLIGVAINRGRILLHRPATSEQELIVDVVIGEQELKVTFPEPGSKLGVEVQPRSPSGVGELPSPPVSTTMYLVEGVVSLASGEKTARLTPDNGWLPLTGEGDWKPIAALNLPEWLSPDRRPPTRTAQQYARLFQEAFPRDAPISARLPAVTRDRRPRIAEMAVETMALTGQLKTLVKALSSEDEEPRIAAIVGIRQWLAQAPGRGELLASALHNEFRDDDVEVLMRLLWGFNEEDARNPIVSEQLVEWLAHPQVAVRELAFYHVSRLTNRRYDYSPMDPPNQREAAIRRWQDHVDRNGGALLE